MPTTGPQTLKNPHAIALGRLGGSANTPAQNAARARNAKLGGYPKGRPRKERAKPKPRSLNPSASPGFGEGRHYQGCGSWTGGKCTCWRVNPTIEQPAQRAKKKGEK